jgi:hypothetical protein
MREMFIAPSNLKSSKRAILSAQGDFHFCINTGLHPQGLSIVLLAEVDFRQTTTPSARNPISIPFSARGNGPPTIPGDSTPKTAFPIQVMFVFAD